MAILEHEGRFVFHGNEMEILKFGYYICSFSPCEFSGQWSAALRYTIVSVAEDSFLKAVYDKVDIKASCRFPSLGAGKFESYSSKD